MSEELISTVAKKDADFLEKLVRKILDGAVAHWENEANSELAKDYSAPSPEYANAFTQWHLLRQCLLSVDTELARGHEPVPSVETGEG